MYFCNQTRTALITIKPFKAIRPSRDKAYLVATRPYYAYKKHVLEAKLETNPYTFLHVINPEFDAENKTKANTPERYQKSRDKLNEFLEQGIFIKEDIESLYLYRQTKNGQEFLGLIGGASVKEYNSGKIKKHEATITAREKHFSEYLKVVECNAEPVLLFHEENFELTSLLNSLSEERPEYEFSTTEKIKHEIWLITDKAVIDNIQKYFADLSHVYIADGHHRCASSARFGDDSNTADDSIQNHFLAYFISEKSMEIFDYNRIVKDLNGMSTLELLSAVQKEFTLLEVNDVQTHIRSLHNILMYIEGKWFNLKIKESLIDRSDPVKSLDTAVLTNYLLDPILGIKDLKTDERINFISGTKGLDGIAESVDSGKYKVGFALFPVTPDQLKAVADNNEIMPPKSTWIEPKLRSGLTMYPLEND